MDYLVVCHGGELEIKAMLLTVSLLENGVNGENIFAAIPKHLADTVSPKTLDIFKRNNVNIHFFDNNYLEKKTVYIPGDAISNKIYALSSIKDTSDIIFLDSDILCRGPLWGVKSDEFDLGAKPADFCLKANWPEIFNKVGVKYPNNKVVCTVDNKTTIPYFNSGVLFFNKRVLAALVQTWIHYFEVLSEEGFLQKMLFDPFHRDQVALAITVQKLNIRVALLTEDDNYPIRRRMKYAIASKVSLVHYHDVYTIAFKKILYKQVQQLIKLYPVIAEVAKSYKLWIQLFEGKLFILTIKFYIRKVNMFIRRL